MFFINQLILYMYYNTVNYFCLSKISFENKDCNVKVFFPICIFFLKINFNLCRLRGWLTTPTFRRFFFNLPHDLIKSIFYRVSISFRSIWPNQFPTCSIFSLNFSAFSHLIPCLGLAPYFTCTFRSMTHLFLTYFHRFWHF